jgi:hypothetical protein
MRYDRETRLVLPTDTRYAAAPVRVLAGVALGFILFAGTLGIGYLGWSVATWGRGQTPAQQLLGLRCWDPKTGGAPSRCQMAERQFLGLSLSGLSPDITAVLHILRQRPALGWGLLPRHHRLA